MQIRYTQCLLQHLPSTPTANDMCTEVLHQPGGGSGEVETREEREEREGCVVFERVKGWQLFLSG